jgi:hypothetical protein
LSDGKDTPGEGNKIAFSEFVLSIATNAIVHLGGDESPPERVSPAIDLAQAAQYIDILMMLKDKTKGNLEKQEEMLIDSLLYDLRMKYLEVKGQGRGRS